MPQNLRFVGLMQYDGDLKLPTHFLVPPPAICRTSGEYLARNGLRTFACSETQKFGHVTFFWNGNRSGYFDESLETCVEIRSRICCGNLGSPISAHSFDQVRRDPLRQLLLR